MAVDFRSVRLAWTNWRQDQKLAKSAFVPWYRTHADLILRLPLSPSTKLTYIWLYTHASVKGDGRWTVAEIGAGLGLGERATQNCLKELESNGLIHRIQFEANQAYTYFLVSPDMFTDAK